MRVKQLSLGVLICGSLDIGYAMMTALLSGTTVATMLRGVASGPFGDAARHWGTGGAVLGLAVHFAIMTAMVAAYIAFASRSGVAALSPWLKGTAYGAGLYMIMNLVVLPLRFPGFEAFSSPTKVALALFPHIAFVGLPLAFMVRKSGDHTEPLSRE